MRNLVLIVPIVVLIVGIAASLLVLAGLNRQMTNDTSTQPSSTTGDLPEVIAAQADVARQLNVSTDSIRVVSADLVDWPDTSLGCPQEGFAYAQVITPGYKVILEYQGQQYEYHTDKTDSAAEAKVIDCTDNPNRHPGYPPGTS